MSILEQQGTADFVHHVVGLFDTAAAGEARQFVETHDGWCAVDFGKASGVQLHALSALVMGSDLARLRLRGLGDHETHVLGYLGYRLLPDGILVERPA
jgi:hypothetical protein